MRHGILTTLTLVALALACGAPGVAEDAGPAAAAPEKIVIGHPADDSLILVYSRSSILQEGATQLAVCRSGGQLQLVTIGRALMTRPKLIMLDEPSQGLAPRSADPVHVLHESVTRAEGTPEEIRQSDEIWEAYPGI